MVTTPLQPAEFSSPAILLSGVVDDEMYRTFRSQLTTEIWLLSSFRRLAEILKLLV